MTKFFPLSPRRAASLLNAIFKGLLVLGLLWGCQQDRTPPADPAAPADNQPGAIFSGPVRTGDLNAVRESKELRILVHLGTSERFPRDDFPNGASLSWLKRFARDQDLVARIVPVAEFDQLIPALLAGKGDVIASNLSVLPERKQAVHFTLPVDTSQDFIVARADDPLAAATDLSGRTIAVTRGTSFASSALELQKQYQDVQIEFVDDHLGDEAILDKLADGSIDLTIADSNYLTAARHYRDDIRGAFPASLPRDIAWAVRPEAINLLGELNRFIRQTDLALSLNQYSMDDFEQIQQRGVLRVAMPNTLASYYLWRGQLYGFDYEMAQRFAEHHGLALRIVVVNEYSELVDSLREGRADIAAGFITPTAWRESINIAFSRPYHYASEILVSRPDSAVTSLDELNTRIIDVRKSSSYWQTLQDLAGQGTILRLRAAPETLTTEQLIDQVGTGKIDLTAADSHILDLELSWRNDVTASLSLGKPRPQSWAVRDSNPQLLRECDMFLNRVYGGDYYQSVHQRYFRAPHSVVKRQLTADSPEANDLPTYTAMIQQYAEQYQFDWRLLAAQVFEESRFDPATQAWTGAQGLMQVMPQTARGMGLENIQDAQTGLHAGVKYMAWLRQQFGNELPAGERDWFALAAYNAGIGHVQDARILARRLGKDPSRWFDHVEEAMLLLAKPSYARKARFGFVRGIEPVRYVSNIRSRYEKNRELEPADAELAVQ